MDYSRFSWKNLISEPIPQPPFPVSRRGVADAGFAPEEAVEVRECKAKDGADGGGVVTHIVTVKQPLPEAARQAIARALPQNRRAGEEARLHAVCRRLETARSPAAKKIPFAPLPQLMFYSPEEEAEVVADADSLYMAAEWNNLGDDLIAADFSISEDAKTFSISLSGGRVHYEKTGDYHLPLLDAAGAPMNAQKLAVWLEGRIRCPHGRYFPETLKKLIGANLERFLRDYAPEQLIRAKYQLAEALKQWLRRHEQKTEEGTAQKFLFDNKKLRCDYSFVFPPAGGYDAGVKPYSGNYVFKKHYYGRIGAFDGSEGGEEFQCAKAIDESPRVEHWIRNMPRRPHSYRLPACDGNNFYPDFIAQLTGGRVLVVEYKGADRFADAALKRRIGEKMEALAAGKTCFVMITAGAGGKSIAQQLAEKINAIPAAAPKNPRKK